MTSLRFLLGILALAFVLYFVEIQFLGNALIKVVPR